MEREERGTSLNKQKKGQKRLLISVNDSIHEEFISKIKETISTINFASIDVAEYVPDGIISVKFNGVAQKPMIYVDPKDLDEQFLSNIEQKSILITPKIEDIKLKARAAFFDITLLPFHPDSVSSALQFVLKENKIIGTGFPVKFYGDTWKEILSELPNISTKHSEAIASLAKNRDQFVAVFGSGTKKGIPQKVIDTVMTFLTAGDPDSMLVQATTTKKRRLEDD